MTDPRDSSLFRRLKDYGPGALVLGALLVFSTPAHARPPFPGIVQDTLGVCPPPCTLCHTSASPDSSNAEQPFAVNLIRLAQAVTKEKSVLESNLPDLLRRLDTDPCQNPSDPSCSVMPCGVCNADGTGKTDIKELEDGDNPNNSDAMHCPTYGCGAHIAPLRKERSLDGTLVLAALGAVAVLARRSRRR